VSVTDLRRLGRESALSPPGRIGGEGKMAIKTRGYEQRRRYREEFWPEEDPWTGENEIGWFSAPRTLPLILVLLGSKNLNKNLNPASVYLELLARHRDNGVIEMVHESEHAYAAGYAGPRGIRTWQERMKILEELGFIKTKQIGNHRHKYVLLVHPTVAIQRLYDEGKIRQHWWDTYRDRQIDTKAALYEERGKPKPREKVVSIKKA